MVESNNDVVGRYNGARAGLQSGHAGLVVHQCFGRRSARVDAGHEFAPSCFATEIVIDYTDSNPYALANGDIKPHAHTDRRVRWGAIARRSLGIEGLP